MPLKKFLPKLPSGVSTVKYNFPNSDEIEVNRPSSLNPLGQKIRAPKLLPEPSESDPKQDTAE
jgi:hypothetical protein